MDWRYLEYNKIVIGMNSRILALFSTQIPPDDWPDALDHFKVANKYTKLGKTSETLLLSLGLSYMKIPLCYRA